MKNPDDEIAKKIKNGSYYEEARKWYMRRYLAPLAERSYLLIIAIALIILLSVSLLNTTSINSENTIMPFPIKVDNSVDYYSIIKPLAKDDESTREAVAKYFILNYLLTREEYIPRDMHGKKLKSKARKIKGSSSKKVLNEYQTYMNSMNPHSPITRYRDHTTRKINIRSIKFTNDDPMSGKATVRFVSIATKRVNQEDNVKKSLWEATVHFKLADIENIARTEAPLRFLVKYYRAKLVK